MKTAPFFSVLLLACACLFASCSSSGTNYYQLSADGPAATNPSGIAIGIGPVRLPDYVDRPELVFQSAENRFEIPLDQRWAGSLRENTTRVLGTNVARRLNTGNLVLYPWPPGAKIDYKVAVDIRRFHAVTGDDAVLEASWTVENAGGNIRRKSGTFTESLAGDGYEAVVAAESRLLGQLAGAIAASLR